MKNKIKEKITMEINGEVVEISPMTAKAVKRDQKRAEKAKALAAMSEEEIKALKIKRRIKIGSIAAGALTIAGGTLIALSKGHNEENETVMLTDVTSDETDDLVAMEEADDEGTTEE